MSTSREKVLLNLSYQTAKNSTQARRYICPGLCCLSSRAFKISSTISANINRWSCLLPCCEKPHLLFHTDKTATNSAEGGQPTFFFFFWTVGNLAYTSQNEFTGVKESMRMPKPSSEAWETDYSFAASAEPNCIGSTSRELHGAGKSGRAHVWQKSLPRRMLALRPFCKCTFSIHSEGRSGSLWMLIFLMSPLYFLPKLLYLSAGS